MPDPVQLLTHEFPPFTGGIGVYVAETAAALARGGWPVTVWAPAYGASEEPPGDYTVRRVVMRGKQDWLCRLRLAVALRRACPDRHLAGTVILAEPGPIRLWMYAHWLGLPRPDRLVVILHGSELAALGGHPRRRGPFRALLRRADCVGVVSAEVKARLAALCPETAAKAVLVPGAVRSVWRDQPVPARTDDPGLLDLVQVGRVHPRKGQHVLVEAVARMPAQVRARLRVRLIGPAARTPYAREVERRLRELGLPIRLEGSLSEEALRAAYETAGIAVLPSCPYRNSVEGLGLALLEAAHFGCAVIGSRIGGIPEALLEGETGLLVPPGDPVALAEALTRLVTDGALRRRMGAAGAAFARKNFSWDRNARLLADPGRPPQKALIPSPHRGPS